ncbi:MAG: NAD(P)H-hydrate dehydratase [Gammaproteobacteria bacterium]|nr:NAD(P)H-hydrate dehydratase [Gammaproteobacteria bacterium]MCW8839524.1 NAD(P)H-hydrate dehydratase [Gammaproteobacteria bacterium]MCW8959597.1 NAD(P)H-hydrate dehydratase [Gammaproteobacteria bacterium]MCW8971839.1 NAD(P)H-hydrate dehydratase [Gammaproteobacteria bacterium]MCW8994111.1 NAD(P)H-hydrate dehydratase [Gammaproteobacteria bacterium]
MRPLPHDLYRAAQVRELDRLAIDYYGISGYSLMSSAGQAVLEQIRRHWPRLRQIAILCGGGNNGGDGYVIARLARQAGIEVEVHMLASPESLRGDARHAYEDAVAAAVSMIGYDGQRLDGFELIVDAMLGTGLSGPPEGIWREAIEAVNEIDSPVVAVDIPSGLSADTGCALGCAVRADLTVSVIGLKRGLFTADGPDHCGKLVFSSLNLPEEVYGHIPVQAKRIDYPLLAPQLAPRRKNSHKGEHGHVLIVGGEQGLAGAARMAGEAAARCGAGLVSVATRSSHASRIGATRPELMCHGVESPEQLNPLLQQATVVAVGPGLGQEAWGRAMLGRILESPLPLVLDADALNLLADEPMRHDKWVLSPHPGEAARMLGCSAAEVQQDRFSAIASLEASYGGVIVLKGCGSLVLGDDGEIALCSEGNPGMACGGMGDLLTGVIAALIAQGMGLQQAARLGVALHGAAGDAATEKGERGMLASDLFRPLRRLVNP